MDDKARQHIVAALMVILLILCVFSSFYGFPIRHVRADATPPTITNPYPSNGSVDIELTPTLNITINDANGNLMNTTFYSNSSGSWQIFGTGGMNTTSEYTYGFEEASELENWTTTGQIYFSTTYAYTGSFSLEIEGASEYAYHNLTLANYSIVNISWWNYPYSIEDNEYLYLRFYDGTDWTTVRTVEGWQIGIEETDTHYYDELDTNNYVFNDDCKICWNVSGGSSTDRYYLDDIDITYGHTGSMPNGTYAMSNSNFTNYSTTYYWNVSVNDGVNTNDSDIFHFTTIADTTSPTIIINFAGNLSDSGGPYWQPPGESTQLTGVWSDGYYTNDSNQREDGISINCTITDTNLNTSQIWVNWLNGTTRTNWTYLLINTGGNYYEFNSSGNITTYEGYDYSFDIVANDTLGNSKIIWWNKTVGTESTGYLTRRTVQLNCTSVSVNYTAFYLYDETYRIGKDDRLDHDQGGGDLGYDTGIMNNTIPSDTVQNRYCTNWIGFWYDNDSSAESGSLSNVYWHIWMNHTSDDLYLKNWKTREHISPGDGVDIGYVTRSDIKSNILLGSDEYHLYSILTTDSSPYNFTDNDIYEIFLQIKKNSGYPDLKNNRSYTSFIIPNVPNNTTLNASHADTDSDGLSDWTELYVNYTNPFLADTDNDGVSDYDESLSGSDPNNYTDTIAYSALTWQNLSYGYLTGGNVTLHTNLSYGYLTGGNITVHQNLSYGYLTGGNTSVKGWTNLSYGYLTGGNVTLHTNLSYGYLTGGNVTAFSNISYGYLTGGNTTAPVIINATGIHSMPRIDPSGIIDVGNTTANATMTITTGYNCSYGVWYGSTFLVDEGNADGNISSTGREYNQTDGTLTASITGLTPGQLYYTTAWVSNPSGNYNSSYYNYSFDNYSYIVNGSGWHYITFPVSIWNNNQSVDDAKDAYSNITIETFLNIGDVLDDVDWIFRVSDLSNWNKGAGGNTLTNLTYDEEYYFKFLNATNISFVFDHASDDNYIYSTTFPLEIFYYNSSINSNNTCENFCQQGGIWEDIDIIFRLDPLQSWIKGRPINTLEEITYNEAYAFYMYNYTANLNFIYDKANSNSTFLTRPDPPNNFSINFNTTNAVITWTKNASANRTIITVKVGSSPTDPDDGTIIYNGTGDNYTDSYADHASRYYKAWSYISWSYNPTLWQISSSNASANTTYIVNPPYNGASTYDDPYLNLTWSRGDRSDQELVVSRNDTYSTSANQLGNWIRQNSTNLYWNDTETESRYYTIWSYNTTNNLYSIVGLNINWAVLVINVYDENSPWIPVTNYDLLITNQDASETYYATGLNNPLIISFENIPFGENTIVQISHDDFETRYTYVDLDLDTFNNHTFYLTPKEIVVPPSDPDDPDGDDDCIIRSFVDSISITGYTVDLVINLTYTLEDFIQVEVYNSSLFGTYGGWIVVANDFVDYNTTRIIINESILDVNSSMARVSYYYESCDPTFLPSGLYYIRIVESYVTSFGVTDLSIEDAKVTFQKYINTTDSYEIIATLFTDANGFVNLYLIPGSMYRVVIEKSGYETKTVSYQPTPPNEFGQTTEQVFRIERTDTEPGDEEVIPNETVVVVPYNTTTFEIYYINLNNNNLFVNFSIYDGSTVIFTYNESVDPDEIFLYFNFSSYSLDNDILTLVVNATKANGSFNIHIRYFSISQAGRMGPPTLAPIAAVLSICLCMFGLTLAHPKKVFGPFGMVVLIMAIAVTAFVPQVWYLHLIQAVELILLIVVALIFKEEGMHAI